MSTVKPALRKHDDLAETKRRESKMKIERSNGCGL